MGFLSAFNKKPSDERQQSIEKLSSLIAGYIDQLEMKGGSLEERSLTLIARSPSTAVARALSLQAQSLERQQMSIRLIFARLAPFELLAELAAALNLTGPRDSKAGSIRQIRTPGLLHAHEQLVLGSSCCWTGDMMRRHEDNRNGLDLWEQDAPSSARLAELAFSAIWTVAKPVPARILSATDRHNAKRTSMTPAMAAAGLASEAIVRQTSGTPVTRH